MSEPVRFHLSLNVVDLGRSVDFFSTLFGIEPAKRRSDYAKFEPAEPPLVLSLEPAAAVDRGGALNHVGLRMPDARSLVAMQERLESRGVRTCREEGVECCYAKQTKFWLHDPDGNLWEVYTLDGDLEHRGGGQTEAAVRGPQACAPRTDTGSWEHRLGEPVPERIPLADGTADEVRLRGTLNLPLELAARDRLLEEARRVLRPGGRLFVHVLAGEAAVRLPGLSGPAAAVQAVPAEAEPLEAVERAGFTALRLLKYDTRPCFVRDGVAMREMQLEAFAPAFPDGSPEDAVAETASDAVEVLYRGPLKEIRADDGWAYPRGRRVRVPRDVADRLSASPIAEHFTRFAAAPTGAACGR